MTHLSALRTVAALWLCLANPAWAQTSSEILTLEAATALALDTAPLLKARQAERDAADGRQAQAGAWPNPALDLEIENFAGSGVFEGGRSAELFAGVSQTVELGGKRDARRARAGAGQDSAALALGAARVELIRDVHMAYESVLVETEALRLARHQEALAEDILALVKKRVKAAASSDIQQSKAEVALSTAQIARANTERALAAARAGLASLIGAGPAARPLDAEHFFELAAPEPLAIYESRLAATPALLMADAEQKARRADIVAARARAVPDPEFRFGVRHFAEGNDTALAVGASVPIPVLNRNEGGIAETEALYRRELNLGAETERRVRQALGEAWQDWQAAHEEAVRFKTGLIPAAEQSFDLSREGYERGRFPFLEVLDAQRTLIEARAHYHAALRRYHQARAEVERLTTPFGDLP